ncbi:MAG: protein translocase subunit SecF [Chloroflexi bacterium]|nr:protein translocase subunit SecF [Chloroflexota bacterium]
MRRPEVFDFVARRHWFLLISLIIAIASLVSALLPGGLKAGIDFKGGISVTLGPKEGETLTTDQVRENLANLGQERAIVQVLGDGDYFIRMGEMDEAQVRSELEGVGVVRDFYSVSPIVASETTRNAAIAMGVAAVAMLIYITWAFRKVAGSLRYGAGAVIALLFNIGAVLGIFSILGRTLDWEIDPMFVTAILAVIGYSVNDAIVVLDRVRENSARDATAEFEHTVNLSINETLTRSLNTTFTTVLAILAVYLFVGGPIRSFLVALLVGVVAGAYSSIFIASQLLVVWERREWTRLIPRIPLLQRSKG